MYIMYNNTYKEERPAKTLDKVSKVAQPMTNSAPNEWL